MRSLSFPFDRGFPVGVGRGAASSLRWAVIAAAAVAVEVAGQDDPAPTARELRRPPSFAEFSDPARNPAAARLLARKKAAETPIVLPPLPDGVEHLDFRDFFRTPVGPLGLEITERLRSLDGKRVRVLGYMVHEDLSRCNSCVAPKTTKSGRPIPAWMEATVPGRMMLTPTPCAVSHAHYGLADDLPPQTIFVTVPDKYGRLVPYTPGPLLLTGKLSVGSKAEACGRNSLVRLELELPPAPSADPSAPGPTTSALGATP